VDVVLDVRSLLGESPSWDEERAEVIWVDILAGEVHLTDPLTGADRRVDFGQTVGNAMRCDDGRLFVARSQDAVFVDEEGLVTEFVSIPECGEWRLNDGKCDPQGRYWVGTLVRHMPMPSGHVFRVNHDGNVEAAISGVGTSNGLGWSPDGRTMYFVDSQLRTVDAFAFDAVDGLIGDRRTLVEIPAEGGYPDGMTVDAEGGIWLALMGAGAIHRFTPTGDLDTVLELPSTNVTACTFGGADLSTLFITSYTGREGVAPNGSLFACRPGVAGMHAGRFGTSPAS
jgi:sugar lactone lactonase YvrE